jgi:5'-nucleotidase
MFKPISDLSQARILISNDDGIHGPGLEVLIEIARRLSDDVWVVAPETEQSGAGHSLTLHQPLRVRQVAERFYAVSGTPTDCVLLAIGHLMTDHKPDLVLSGVNRGGNMGDDVTYSGTIAAAMEGTLLGVPSLALSQVYTDGEPVPWETARQHGPDVIRKVVRQGWGRNVLMNVNFPPIAPDAVSGLVAASQGRRKIGDGLLERIDPRGKPYLWIGPQRNGPTAAEGTDLYAIERGAITVTPLCIDLTDRATLATLEGAFSQL